MQKQAYSLRLRRLLALLLVLSAVMAPVVTAYLPDFYKVSDPLECAIYLNSRMKYGKAEAYIEIPQGASQEKFFVETYDYLRILYSDYCALYRTWFDDPHNTQININMQGAESGRVEAEALAAKVVRSIISAGMTQMEKLGAIHDYVIQNCEYDYVAAQNQQTASRDAFTAFGMLSLGKGVCDAYSAAFALLCKQAGIPCMYFLSDQMNHSWNVVLLGGKIFFVDTTYDDTGVITDPREFFMLTAEQLREKGHKWDGSKLGRVIEAVWGAEFQPANNLSALGLFKGTGIGFELERSSTRAEASVMLLRLMGLEKAAEREGPTLKCPFTDVSGYFEPYVAYMRAAGLTQGTSATTFSPGNSVNAQQYMTLVLRALGYDDQSGDFEWSRALDASVEYGVLTRSEARAYASAGSFTRGDMAAISMKALYAKKKDGLRLVDYLIGKGIINRTCFAEIEKYS